MFFLDIIDHLIHWDQKLFTYINSKWTNSFFDGLLPFLRESAIWAPVYLFLIVFVWQNLRKYKWWHLGFTLLTVTLTDVTSSRLIKHTVQRLRPCNDPIIADKVRLLLNHCSGGFSFTSSHAANHFGIAMFLYLTCKSYSKWFTLFFVWALAIAYAQVYVGVHYPLDVFCGMCVGLLLGWITAKLYVYCTHTFTTASSPYN